MKLDSSADDNYEKSVESTTRSDPALEKTWRRIDFRIIPVTAIIYLLAFLDRTNIGNARIAGLQKDLRLTDRQYSIAVTITFIPYILIELPSNLLLKAVGPNRLLPTLLTLWGVSASLQGAVSSYRGLLVCRFFLGLFEGGLSPALVLYLSCFYPRQKLNWRISLVFTSAGLGGVFSGLLAYGIVNIDRFGHVHGWAWIFILEGLFTIIFGMCSYFLLPSSPQDCKFLGEEEKSYVLKVLRDTCAIGNEEDDKFSWVEVRHALTSPHVLMNATMTFFTGTMTYGFAYFTPSIVRGLGYTATDAQLFSVPPFAAAFVVSMICAYISDRYQCRGFIVVFSGVLCVIGFGTNLVSKSFKIKYCSLFLSLPGAVCAVPTLSAWIANNSAPLTRRAASTAAGFITANAGGILVTWLFGTLSPPPLYREACITILTFSVLLIVLSVVSVAYLWTQNRKKAVKRESVDEKEEKTSLGDKSSWFIYCL